MFEPIKIHLNRPLMHGEKEITELVFGREMEAGDLRGVSLKDMTHDHIWDVTSRITGVPAPIIRKMKMSDYLRVAEVVGGFFDDSPLTGKKA